MSRPLGVEHFERQRDLAHEREARHLRLPRGGESRTRVADFQLLANVT